MKCKLNFKVIILIIIVILIPAMLIFMDLLNIRNFVILTDKYDWLNFIGTFLAGICTLFLGIVSYFQNKSLEKINKAMIGNDLISNCYSKIDVKKDHYIDLAQKRYENSIYGLKMTNDVTKGNNYIRMVLLITDIKNLPLIDAMISEIVIEYNYLGEFSDNIFEQRKYVSNYFIPLEAMSEGDEFYYYLPVCILDELKYLQRIYKSNNLKITFNLEVKNSFGVISSGEYTLKLLSTSNNNKYFGKEYKLDGRKIYFKKVVYEGEKYGK